VSLPLQIADADPLGEAALGLLREAAIDARALYPELHTPGAPWPTNEPLTPRAVYLIVWQGQTPVGMGALRPLDDHCAEVRRMYVHRDWRRHGIGRELLRALQARARALGYRALRLETGPKQQPAMALYEGFGFQRIAPFGPYVGDPTSVCYELRL